MDVLTFGFSFRRDSYSRAVAEACVELAPEDLKIKLYDIKDIPLFNQDNEKDLPESVKSFKAAIKASDAILIVMPEYNYSVPGYLKNAIDYASRPYGDNSFYGKYAAMITESIGILGGSRAQYHMRQIFVPLGVKEMKRPELFIPFIHEKVSEGKLVDKQTRINIAEYLKAFRDFILNR
ncbi:MAG: FMN-dependent NADH-azoreductase [Candidatus Micrarchaeota archaeon]|nr:MAG: FMN-dependent NADH-azoreductase [Candidatus Micrarchaeota archaeon]